MESRIEKFIGLVKWFHDQAKDANYGFIQHAILGDLFFHEKSIEQGQNINSFRENEMVVFHSQESKKHKGKLEAINVKLLINETDLEFLFLHFLSLLKEKNNYSDYNIIQKGVHNKISILLESTNDEQIKAQLLSLFIDYINNIFATETILNEESLKSLLKIGKSFFKTNYSQITEIIETNVSEEIKHKFWLEEYFNFCQCNFIAKRLLAISENERNKVFQRCTIEDNEQIFKHFYTNFRDNTDSTFFENEESIRELLKLSKKYFNNNYTVIKEYIESKTPIKFAHKFWLEGNFETCQINYIASILLQITESERNKVFQRCSIEDNEQIFNHFYTNFRDNTDSSFFENEESIRELLKLSKKYFNNNYTVIKEYIESKTPIEFAHKFWLEGNFETCQINYIASILLQITEPERNKIFQRCVLEEKANIFFSLLYNIEKIDTQEKLQTSKQILNLSKKYDNDNYGKIIIEILNKSPDYYILDLWIENYHESLDFNLFKPYIVTLKPENQKKYVKKVLSYIHTEKIKLSVEDFTSLNLMDYETSKLIEQIDQSHFDYSTSIILNVISELQNHSKLETRKEANQAQYKIYDLILKQIKEPIDILQITGYFDECSGRCSISISNEQKNEDGVIISREIEYKRNEHHKPKFHPICDGRKAVNKDTKEPILSDDSKVEFWWCANQKCYKPSRELHNSENWEKYTLLDFLSILKINFKYSDLEIYLNIINKANRFLKHLKCRECNHILYPKGKTQYAFYGVSNFVCKKETCSEHNKEIYLSHCLNGNCELEIDSRDSVKCKPSGVDADTCGWYVCNNCNSCCSSPQLEKRKWVYDNILHKDYKCHLEGHRDLGIVSCNKCGDSMETNSTDIIEFEKILKWFIENKDKSQFIDKSGKNKFDKWWFKLVKGNLSYKQFKERLSKYLKIGFNLPDFDIEIDKDYQLIAEPIMFKNESSDILSCKTCGHTIDLTNDLEKARAIKTFHKIKFAKETTET